MQIAPKTLFLFTFFNFLPDNDTGSKRPESVASSVDCKDNELDNKHRDSVEIKREGSVQYEDDFQSLPPLKRLRADCVDAESNTTNSGKYGIRVAFIRKIG